MALLIIYFTPLSLGVSNFKFWQIFFDPLQGGSAPKSKNSKFLQTYVCYGYSKLVIQDAWHNAKGIGSIQPSCSEKTKTWFNFAVLGWRQDIPINIHVLDIFSGQGDQIDLISFVLCYASWDTYIWELWIATLGGGDDPTWGGSNNNFRQKLKLFRPLWKQHKSEIVYNFHWIHFPSLGIGRITETLRIITLVLISKLRLRQSLKTCLPKKNQ